MKKELIDKLDLIDYAYDASCNQICIKEMRMKEIIGKCKTGGKCTVGRTCPSVLFYGKSKRIRC